MYFIIVFILLFTKVNGSQYNFDFPPLDAKTISFYDEDSEEAENICILLNYTREIIIDDSLYNNINDLESTLGELIIYALSNSKHWTIKNESKKVNTLKNYFNSILDNLDENTTYIDLEMLENHINRGVYIIFKQKKWRKKKNKNKVKKIQLLLKKVFRDQIYNLLCDQIIHTANDYLKRSTIESNNTEFIFKILNRKNSNISIFHLEKKLLPWKRTTNNFIEKYQTLENNQHKRNRVFIQSMTFSKTINKNNRELIKKRNKRSSS
jgi:predicted RNA-binding protein YlxR (DUF448 family)